MVILTLNCGSSSAKYQVYDWENKDILAVGVVERIGLEYSTIEHKATGNGEYRTKFSSPTHKEAIELIIRMLQLILTTESSRASLRLGQWVIVSCMVVRCSNSLL